jgi:SAM-dependent methyltransferase
VEGLQQNAALRDFVMFDIEEHQRQIQENLGYWNAKPVLREVYREFHQIIAENLCDMEGETIELGSGIGNIKEVIPHCVRTDLFPNPWIDRQENAYALSMADNSGANLILFDVFHHLEYPMNAMQEFHRVLKPGGRLLVFDHAMSITGWIFSRFVHHERAGFFKPYHLQIADRGTTKNAGYYADHANAYRIFEKRFRDFLGGQWDLVQVIKLPALKWIASGGYRGPNLLQPWCKNVFSGVESILETIPGLFALRLLAVVEKK